MKHSQKHLLFLCLVVLLVAVPAFADEGLSTFSDNDLLAKAGKLIRMIGGAAAPIILAWGFLMKGLKSSDPTVDSNIYIKNGIIGAVCSMAAWGAGQWLYSAFK